MFSNRLPVPGQTVPCVETLSLVPPRGKSLEDMYNIY